MAAIQDITREMVFSLLPPRAPESHKGNYGKVLAVCGCAQYRGAALLACLGALRAGAGDVYKRQALQTHMKRPEAKFFHYVLPAMASQLLTGFFIIVDGFYIGQSIGDVGLASINLLWQMCIRDSSITYPCFFMKFYRRFP